MDDTIRNIVLDGEQYLIESPVLKISGLTGNQTVYPNKYYEWDTLTSSVVVTKGEEENEIVNEYHMVFPIGAAGIQIQFSGWTSSILWHGGEQPAFNNGSTLEISIVDGLGLWAEYK